MSEKHLKRGFKSSVLNPLALRYVKNVKWLSSSNELVPKHFQFHKCKSFQFGNAVLVFWNKTTTENSITQNLVIYLGKLWWIFATRPSFQIFAVNCISPNFNRSIHPEVFLEKGVLKMCSKFTGEHPCRRAIFFIKQF